MEKVLMHFRLLPLSSLAIWAPIFLPLSCLGSVLTNCASLWPLPFLICFLVCVHHSVPPAYMLADLGVCVCVCLLPVCHLLPMCGSLCLYPHPSVAIVVSGSSQPSWFNPSHLFNPSCHSEVCVGAMYMSVHDLRGWWWLLIGSDCTLHWAFGISCSRKC